VISRASVRHAGAGGRGSSPGGPPAAAQLAGPSGGQLPELAGQQVGGGVPLGAGSASTRASRERLPTNRSVAVQLAPSRDRPSVPPLVRPRSFLAFFGPLPGRQGGRLHAPPPDDLADLPLVPPVVSLLQLVDLGVTLRVVGLLALTLLPARQRLLDELQGQAPVAAVGVEQGLGQGGRYLRRQVIGALRDLGQVEVQLAGEVDAPRRRGGPGRAFDDADEGVV